MKSFVFLFNHVSLVNSFLSQSLAITNIIIISLKVLIRFHCLVACEIPFESILGLHSVLAFWESHKDSQISFIESSLEIDEEMPKIEGLEDNQLEISLFYIPCILFVMGLSPYRFLYFIFTLYYYLFS